MRIEFSEIAAHELEWFERNKPKLAEKIAALLSDIQKTPYKGLGKPEPLKYQLSGYWSRRINSEHRLVYCIKGKTIIVVQCKYHYGTN